MFHLTHVSNRSPEFRVDWSVHVYTAWVSFVVTAMVFIWRIGCHTRSCKVNTMFYHYSIDLVRQWCNLVDRTIVPPSTFRLHTVHIGYSNHYNHTSKSVYAGILISSNMYGCFWTNNKSESRHGKTMHGFSLKWNVNSNCLRYVYWMWILYIHFIILAVSTFCSFSIKSGVKHDSGYKIFSKVRVVIQISQKPHILVLFSLDYLKEESYYGIMVHAQTKIRPDGKEISKFIIHVWTN